MPGSTERIIQENRLLLSYDGQTGKKHRIQSKLAQLMRAVKE